MDQGTVKKGFLLAVLVGVAASTLALAAEDEFDVFRHRYRELRQRAESDFARAAAARSAGTNINSEREISFGIYVRLLDKLKCLEPQLDPFQQSHLPMPFDLCAQIREFHTNIMLGAVRLEDVDDDVCLQDARRTSWEWLYPPFPFLSEPWNGKLRAYDSEAFVQCLRRRI